MAGVCATDDILAKDVIRAGLPIFAIAYGRRTHTRTAQPQHGYDTQHQHKARNAGAQVFACTGVPL